MNRRSSLKVCGCGVGAAVEESSGICRKCGNGRAEEAQEPSSVARPAEPEQSASATLSLAHAFGVYPEAIRGAVISLGDDACAFAVGRHLAVWDFSKKREFFLPREDGGAVVTALAKSGNGRLLAIAERQSASDDRHDGAGGLAQITILGLPAAYAPPPSRASSASGGRTEVKEGTLKVLHPPGKRHTKIVDLAFTPDARHLVSVSAMPETTVTYWRWEIEKVISSHDVQLPITRLQVNPNNGHQISISGPGYMRFWDYNPNDHALHENASVFSLKQEKQLRIVDHCWVHEEGFLCVASYDGHVFLFHDGEMQQDIDIRAMIAKDESTGQKAIEREQAQALAKMMGSKNPTASAEPPPVCLVSLALWGQGFVVGGDQGYLGIFKVDAKCQVEPLGTFRMPGEETSLWCMSASSEDSHLTICAYSEKDAESDPAKIAGKVTRAPSRRSVGGTESVVTTSAEEEKERVWSLTVFPVSQADLAGTGQLELFRPIVPMGTHAGPIVSMASSPARRVVATCGGNDKELKIWSYPAEDGMDQPVAFASEMSVKVSTFERPRSMAMHPFGFQVAVIMEDTLRVFHITTQQATRILFDLPLKHPGSVAYSNSGDLLAVTSSNDVILVDPWKGILVRMFSGSGGHLSFVNQVSFSADDKMLLSCSAAPSGAIYGWSMESEAKERAFEHVSKGTDYTAFTYDFLRKLVVAVTREGHLRMMGHLDATLVDLHADSASSGYTAVVLAAHIGLLFAGMRHGAVRVLNWPLRPGGIGNNSYRQVALHAHSVTALSLSTDTRLLFSACRGGAMMASEVGGSMSIDGATVPLTAAIMDSCYTKYRRREGAEKAKNKGREDIRKATELQKKLAEACSGMAANAATLDDMIMLPRNYYQDLLSEIRHLEERMATLKHESEFAIEAVDKENQDKVGQLRYEMQVERQQAEEKYTSLFDQHKKALARHGEEVKAANADFERRARARQEEFEAKIALEYEKQSRLLNELEALKEEHVQDVAKHSDKHGEQLQELRSANESAIREWRVEYEKVCALLKSDSLKFEEALRQQETEYEEEISEVLELKRKVLQVESEKSTTALKDGVSMKQTITMLQSNILELKGKLEESEKQRGELQKQLEASREMFANVQEQLKEEKRALKVKGESLAKIREQMKHLESFRFVLFHKVKQMEEERDPLAEQVNSLKSSVRDMYSEFVREFRNKQRLDQQLHDKTRLTASLQEENIVLNRQLIQLKKDARRLLNDVEQVLHAESAADFERMPKRLMVVIEKHQKLSSWTPADEEGKDKSADNESKQQMMINEMVVQRDLLFKKNQMSVSQSNQIKRECGQDLRRLTSENAALINEMNTLRNENRSLTRSCREMEASLIALRAKDPSRARGGGAEGGGGGASRSESAPDLVAPGFAPGGRKGGGLRGGIGAGGAVGGAAAGETPYVRRKVVDQQETLRRMKQKQMNQLPPVHDAPGHRRSNSQDVRLAQAVDPPAGRSFDGAEGGTTV